MGKKIYVGDVFDIDKEVKVHGNKIFLIAGVGSGKSTWVKEILTKKGSVLFVTSRKAKVEEDIANSCFSDLFKWHTDNQTLVTNAKLAVTVERITDDYMKDLDEFIDHFDYIVIDEVHSIATDSTFADSCMGVFSFMEYVVNKGKIIVAMTGTPEPIEYYFKENGWNVIDYRNKCNYVHPEEIWITTKRSIWGKIRRDWGERKIIYFVNETDTIADMCSKLLDKEGINIEDIAVIVAKSKESIMQEKLEKKLGKTKSKIIGKCSKEVYENIVLNSKIPDKCKILLSTSTLREGVDIKNDNITMFCDNHILSNLIQFFGRARQEGCKVYVIENVAEHRVEQDELLYQYGLNDEVNAANHFYETQITNDVFDIIKREKLIKYLKKNPYIYFDYIEKKFKISHMKYNEQERVKNNFNWKEELITYCNDYNIPFLGIRDMPGVMREGLHRFLAMEKEIYVKKKEKEVVLNMFRWAYGIEDEQYSKINDELEKKDADIRVISDVCHKKGENRGKTYWLIVSPENEEFIKWKTEHDKKKEE